MQNFVIHSRVSRFNRWLPSIQLFKILLVSVLWAAVPTQAAPPPEATPLGPPQMPFGYANMNVLWRKGPDGTAQIPVCWQDAKSESERERLIVRQVIASTWETVAAVRFTGWKACQRGNSGIHIAVTEGDPEVKALGTGIDKVESGMSLNFDFSVWGKNKFCAKSRENTVECIKIVAVHEFGHALGLAHEHNRNDTPCACNQAPQGENGTKHLTPWDAESVMNYCNPIYREGGWKLSSGDIKSIQEMYGVRL